MSNKILHQEGGNKMKAFVYILAANKNPDKISGVPWKTDDKEIFFGPCKKRLRKVFRKFLNENKDHSNEFDDDYYLIGLNGLSRERKRKIVWAGKLKEVMTFAYAYKQLNGMQYLEMRDSDNSPLHVKPIEENRKLVGYEFLNKMHGGKNNEWVSDLVSKQKSKEKSNEIEITKNKIIAKNGNIPFYTFDRDSCLLFENIFFAKHGGIDIDNEVLKIFKSYFKEKGIDENDIDAQAIFGKDKNGKPNGMRGSWLEFDSQLTQRLIKLIAKKAEKIKKDSKSSPTENIYKTNKNKQRGCK